MYLKKCGRHSHFMLRRPVSNGGGFTPSEMLGLTSRATPIRRIRIQRGPCSLFTHTSNNAGRMVRFQKKCEYLRNKTLKFSNAVVGRYCRSPEVGIETAQPIG
jgi:hypothetical protein